MKTARRPRANGPEAAFEQLALRRGWRPTKRGWPDFLCFGPKGEVIAVEVKPQREKHADGESAFRSLRADQVACMTQLTTAGIKCYVSDGVTLEPFNPWKHTRRYAA